MEKMKRILVMLTCTLLLTVDIPADPFETGRLVETLREQEKLPRENDWGKILTETLAAEAAGSHTVHPLTVSIIADSIQGFTGNEDPAMAAREIAEAIRNTDRQIRRGIPQPRIRQEARKRMSEIVGQSAEVSGQNRSSSRGNRGRETAQGVRNALDNPGRGNIPFSSIPGRHPGEPDIPGQGQRPVPESREEPNNSGNHGEGSRPNLPF